MKRSRILISEAGERSELLFRKIDAQLFSVDVRDFAQLHSLAAYDLVIPITLPDTNYLNQNFHAQRGLKYFAPTTDIAQLAHNKIAFNQFLVDRGFAAFVPQVNPSSYPLVLKKNKDAGGNHSHLIQSVAEMQSYRHLLANEEYFQQIYVPGRTEYTTHLFVTPHRCDTVTVRFQMNRDRYIRGVRMQPFKNVEVDVVPGRFDDLFAKILCELDYQGFGCFNYKVIDDLPQIFELNPRIGGSAHFGINQLLNVLRPSVLQKLALARGDGYS